MKKIYRDSEGVKIKPGDFIKTERGVVLEVIEINNELYIKNSGNGQVNHIDIISINFKKIPKTQII